MKRFGCRVFHFLPFFRCFSYAEYIKIKGTKKKNTQTTAFWCTRKSGARNRIFAWFLFCTRCVNNNDAKGQVCESTYECMCDDIREISNNVNEAVNKSAQNTQKTHSNSHTRVPVCVCEWVCYQCAIN